jgi:hypothetical protein
VERPGERWPRAWLLLCQSGAFYERDGLRGWGRGQSATSCCQRGRMVSKRKRSEVKGLRLLKTILPPASNMHVLRPGQQQASPPQPQKVPFQPRQASEKSAGHPRLKTLARPAAAAPPGPRASPAPRGSRLWDAFAERNAFGRAGTNSPRLMRLGGRGGRFGLAIPGLAPDNGVCVNAQA